MKKEYAVVYLLVALIPILFVLTRVYPNARFIEVLTSATVSVRQQQVTVSIDFGDTKRMYGDIRASTALDALKEAVKRDNLALSGKQYDFGFLVEKIGDRANTKEKAWIYFVNGAAGDVASDKKTLAAGDMVEWRYVKPN